MRLGHVVKGEILDLIKLYQSYIDELVDNVNPMEVDNTWWDRKNEYMCKIEVLEELLERLE